MESAMNELPADFSFEKALLRLREVVEAMQKGGGKLQDQMTLFREGQVLANQCRIYLEQAEMEVNKLTAGGTSPLEKSYWMEEE
jgi:exodeoxyribonuclease VII small subunit